MGKLKNLLIETAEDEEFNRIEMESRIKQEYIRNMKPHVPFMSISVDDYLKLSEELALARVLIRELGDRLAKLEKTESVGKLKELGWNDEAIHKANTPQRKPLTDEEILSIAREHYNPHQRPEISFARAIEAKLKEKNT